MAFTVKVIQELPNDFAAAVKAYLDGASVTTMHSITTFRTGQYITCVIIFE